MAGLASQGLSVLFLKYSRDAENQADLAGFRYALNENYDVREMSNVFQTLDRISQRRRRQAARVARDPPESRHPHQNTQARLDTLTRTSATRSRIATAISSTSRT